MTIAVAEQELESTPTAFFGAWSIAPVEHSSRTNHSSRTAFIHFGPEVALDALDIFALGQTATDVGARDRLSFAAIDSFAKNLRDYSLVAKAMIPGLREMTAKERRNLHNYYKKMYRKV